MESVNWTDTQILKLIEIWGEEDIQEQLETAKRNKHVYDGMAEQLQAYGINKSGEQVCSKVKKLRHEYKKIRDGHKETGNKRKRWKYYKLNEIMANRPSVAPPVVLDTLDSSGTTSSTENITSDEEKSREITDNEKEENDSGDEIIVKSKYASNAVEKSEKKCVTIKG